MSQDVSQKFDDVLEDIVEYVKNYQIKSETAYKIAQYCLIDTLGCGLEALDYPECTKLLILSCKEPPFLMVLKFPEHNSN